MPKPSLIPGQIPKLILFLLFYEDKRKILFGKINLQNLTNVIRGDLQKYNLQTKENFITVKILIPLV